MAILLLLLPQLMIIAFLCDRQQNFLTLSPLDARKWSRFSKLVRRVYLNPSRVGVPSWPPPEGARMTFLRYGNKTRICNCICAWNDSWHSLESSWGSRRRLSAPACSPPVQRGRSAPCTPRWSTVQPSNTRSPKYCAGCWYRAATAAWERKPEWRDASSDRGAFCWDWTASRCYLSSGRCCYYGVWKAISWEQPHPTPNYI